MIIRSQDKKILTDNLNLEIVTSDVISTKFADFGEKKGEQSKIYNSVGLCMGEYSTEEKAIKVLDMIQVAYEEANSVCTMSGFVANTVFQMPNDSEVQICGFGYF